MGYTSNVTLDLSTPPERDVNGRIVKAGVSRVVNPGQSVTGLDKDDLQALIDAGHVSKDGKAEAEAKPEPKDHKPTKG
ncbi:hypothetical protein FVQ98_14065 [Ottowia sp. GY511]|uniref:Mu-like prophage FluMu N-terminal domain-containing protein n=1 Tax=Ottowia flava TaxID=2675430 RepID=A0ABW4KP16_9BURK|nr:hypothetical protein [Ottowia sp. GY511]TXK26498.1 hypothetical protein FVQ98_14065 [Ottowia sp. GY511]